MHRSLARVVVALVSFLVGGSAAASAASAAGAVSVSPSSGLTAGQVITVTGTGYVAADNPVGVYAGQIAQIGDTVYSNMAASSWVSSLDGDGGFTTTLTPTRTFTSNSTTIDCAIVQCKIGVWRAHGNPLPAGSAPQPGAYPLDGEQDISFAVTPSLSVSPTADLDPAGDTVPVAGTGFLKETNLNGAYVAQAATVDGLLVYRGAKWVAHATATGGAGASAPINNVGAFSTTVDVVGSGTFTVRSGQGQPAGSTRDVDCAEVACSIVTWSAHSAAAAPSFSTSTPIAFAAGEGPEDPGTGPGGAFGLAVSPTSGLPTDGPSTVTVTGSGYSATEPGIYVVYGPLAGQTDRNAFYGGAQWLHVGGGNLSVTGSFSTTLAVAPTYTDGNGNVVNCTVVQCYVQTMRAHGFTDINQDFAVPVTFGATVETPAPDANAAQAPTDAPLNQAPSTPAPNTGSSGPAVGPTLGKLTVASSGRASLQVSERSTVTFVLRKKVGGTWKVVKVVRVKAAGAGTVGAKLPVGAAGTYRISIKAVSSVTGKTSKKVVKNLTVKAKKKQRG